MPGRLVISTDPPPPRYFSEYLEQIMDFEHETRRKNNARSPLFFLRLGAHPSPPLQGPVISTYLFWTNLGVDQKVDN